MPTADPSPPDAMIPGKSRGRLRAVAPTLVAALIHDRDLPSPEIRHPRPATPEQPPTKKQRAAARKRKQREAQLAREREIRKAIELQAEIIAEDQAPAAQRANGSATPHPTTGGYRRTDPLALMCRRSRSGEMGRTVTNDHLRAKRRLLDDYQTGILGATRPRSGIGRVDGGDAQEQEFVWLSAAARYNTAMEAVGPSLAPVVKAMALADWTVSRLAACIGASEVTTTGLIVAAFDRLADHYWPERETRARAVERALGALAKPLGFDFAVGPGGLVIPADRIGIGRVVQDILALRAIKA